MYSRKPVPDEFARFSILQIDLMLGSINQFERDAIVTFSLTEMPEARKWLR
jgi:hypothetical protein